jgi:hypothetical protein
MPDRDDKIHIKLELYKDKKTDKLKLMTYFKPDAPNFLKDKEGYFWIPTVEEKNFLYEVFELISNDRINCKNNKKIENEPTEKKEEKKTRDTPPVDKTEEETVFKSAEETPEFNESENINTEEKQKISIEADEAAIDAALKNKEDNDASMIQVDENTIVEKILSHKKKGRWFKNR